MPSVSDQAMSHPLAELANLGEVDRDVMELLLDGGRRDVLLVHQHSLAPVVPRRNWRRSPIVVGGRCGRAQHFQAAGEDGLIELEVAQVERRWLAPRRWDTLSA